MREAIILYAPPRMPVAQLLPAVNASLNALSGVFLVIVGLLLVTGMWTELMFWLRSWAATTGIGSSL